MKIAIITGASRGLGKELLDLFEKGEWFVIDFSRTGKNKNTVKIDLSDIVKTYSTIENTFSKFKINEIENIVLINNAAILLPIKNIKELDLIEISTSINTNIVSQISLIHLFMKYFKDISTEKYIINISSGAALKGFPSWGLYCTAKAGMENFINCINEEEYFSKNNFIGINYDPYIMDTEMQLEIRNVDINCFPIKNKFLEYKNENKLLHPKLVAEKIFSRIIKMDFTKTRYNVKEEIL